MRIALDLIQPSSNPVRQTWDEDKMNALAQSIAEQGVIVPIKVRPLVGDEFMCRWHNWQWVCGHVLYDDHDLCETCETLREEAYILDNDDEIMGVNRPLFEIVYGHRRVEASRRAGVADIEVLIEGLDDGQALLQAGIENIQREDMNALDKARWLQSIKDEFGWSNMEFDRRGIMTDGYVGRLLALLSEPKEIQDLIEPQTESEANSFEGTITRIRQGMPNDPIKDRIAVVQKAAREKLPLAVAKEVAEAVHATPDPIQRRRLIEAPYNPAIHNAEVRREVAKQEAKAKPRKQANEASAFEWSLHPESAEIIHRLKRNADDLTYENLRQWRRMVEIGKFPAEGLPFLARAMKRTATALRNNAKSLDDLADWMERQS